ncbi:MAG: hypothetical protein WKF84_17480 [Pyrinomonadaceae bacterium]
MLDKRLQVLAEHADFHVNINSVIGGGIRNPEDALVIGRRAVELGFTSTVGVIHDDSGHLKPLNEIERRVFEEMQKLSKRNMRASTDFRGISQRGAPIIGAAAPALAIYTSAKKGLCTTARSSAGVRASSSKNILSKIFGASTIQKSPAHRSVP